MISTASALLDAFDGRVEDVAGAAERRIERGAVLAAVDVLRAERLHQQLQRIHLLDRGEIAGDGADPAPARPWRPRRLIAAKASGQLAGASLPPLRT